MSSTPAGSAPEKTDPLQYELLPAKPPVVRVRYHRTPRTHPASLLLNEKNRVENLNCQFVLMSNFLNITDDVGIGLISLVVSQLVALPRPMDTVKGGRAGHGN